MIKYTIRFVRNYKSIKSGTVLVVSEDFAGKVISQGYAVYYA